MHTVTQPEFIADLGVRAAAAAAAGEATFAVPELAGVARAIAQDARAGSLGHDAGRWEEAGASYHDLVRLSSHYVRALDRASPPLPTVYVAKACGELEPMLQLWPHVLVLPTTTKPSERELIELRAFPVHILGIVAQVEWADGRPCPPAEFFYHDLDHARFKLREDLAAQGVDIPDAYQNGTTLDPETGRHRLIVYATTGHAATLWQGSAERLALARRLFASIDALTDRAQAIAADVLLFEIIHEKSFPLEPRVLRRELSSSAHLERIRSKLATGFYGLNPPPSASVASLEAARSWLLEAL
jgi:hypothetical protein